MFENYAALDTFTLKKIVCLTGYFFLRQVSESWGVWHDSNKSFLLTLIFYPDFYAGFDGPERP